MESDFRLKTVKTKRKLSQKFNFLRFLFELLLAANSKRCDSIILLLRCNFHERIFQQALDFDRATADASNHEILPKF